ncbi:MULTISPECIES: zinc-binding dehydrogenase [unclassified Sporosarcina]|uniref:zinc-binding dehydrogenase n=1 Tax=unclassified Sporosarcina TaxID=2647733 RepID=UPI00203A9879|nr:MULTISPECIES: alcohol dehydrogenase catalytic domain-containing protein [unclassified Sporosarcina]GKV65854.1 putative zinc-type alcohol dehydrogenase-like protein YjmD [Sporosarcina sp. NCCP-2331]GLB55979.1 putative zinc-type alcohol dehydrogenase-like protein YjmD [Sporosarcina sp. NCCP-2378]
MLAAVFEDIGKLSLQNKNIPEIESDNQVKVKVEAASICGSDIHILSEPPTHPATTGIIQGHEFIGEIVEIGKNVRNVAVGDRVVIDPTVVCGDCFYCKLGKQNLCENFSTIGIFENGGWAPYSVIPSQNVHRISKEVPAEVAVLAEPLSCVINGSEKLQMSPGDSVVILGAGPMGQLFTQVQKSTGAGKVIVVDLSDYRLNYAKESGATHTINPNEQSVEELVHEITQIGADIVIDCVGVLFDQALDLVRKGGKILLVGMNENARPPIKQFKITQEEITVYGTIIQNNHFPKVIKILESGMLKLDHLITHQTNLGNIHEAIDIMRTGEAIKIIVYPESEGED